MKLRIRILAIGACALAAGCSQIPWDSSPANDKPAPAPGPASAAAAAAAPLALPIAVPPAPVSAPSPAAVAPSAPVGPALMPDPRSAEAFLLPPKPRDAKELEPPHSVDLARPADDLWDRIRKGFAMPDLDGPLVGDRKSTRLNSSHTVISYAVFCLKKK